MIDLMRVRRQEREIRETIERLGQTGQLPMVHDPANILR